MSITIYIQDNVLYIYAKYMAQKSGFFLVKESTEPLPGSDGKKTYYTIVFVHFNAYLANCISTTVCPRMLSMCTIFFCNLSNLLSPFLVPGIFEFLLARLEYWFILVPRFRNLDVTYKNLSRNPDPEPCKINYVCS